MDKIPFTALTVSCVGGAYNGIGIHQYRLNEMEEKRGMQVLSFAYDDLPLLTYTVLFLL